MFGKLHAKLDGILGILKLLPTFMADAKATWVVVQHDIADLKAGQAKLEAITGHTATVTAMAAQASVPTSVPVVLPPIPGTTMPGSGTSAQALQKDLGSIVAGVDPTAGVHMP